jgi:hypothetical protein
MGAVEGEAVEAVEGEAVEAVDWAHTCQAVAACH